MEVKINRKSVSSNKVFFHEIKCIFEDESYLLLNGVVEIYTEDKEETIGDSSLSNGTKTEYTKEIVGADVEISESFTKDGESVLLPNTIKANIEELIEEQYKQLQFID
jgi:hypothetical protein